MMEFRLPDEISMAEFAWKEHMKTEAMSGVEFVLMFRTENPDAAHDLVIRSSERQQVLIDGIPCRVTNAILNGEQRFTVRLTGKILHNIDEGMAREWVTGIIKRARFCEIARP